MGPALMVAVGSLLLAASSAEESKSTIEIDNIRYHIALLTNIRPNKNILIDENGDLFFISGMGDLYKLKADQKFIPKKIDRILNGTKISMQSIEMEENGDIIISTNKQGFYKYNPEMNSISLYVDMDKHIVWTATAPNGSIFASDYDTHRLYRIQNREIKEVSGLSELSAFAFDGMGNLYYRSLWSHRTNFLVKSGRPQSERILIKGFLEQASVWHIAYDKYADRMYFNNDNIYFLKPPSNIVTKLKGIKDVKGLGFDRRGNMYVGMETKLYKLTPLTKIPCDFEGSTTDQLYYMMTQINKRINNIQDSILGAKIELDTVKTAITDKIANLENHIKILTDMLTKKNEFDKQ